MMLLFQDLFMAKDEMKKTIQKTQYLKVLLLLFWLLPLYIYCNLYMMPFAKPYTNIISLNNDLFIRATGFSKYNIYLSTYPSVIYMLFFFAAFKYTIDNINNMNNNLYIKIHCYLLSGFLIVIYLYYAAIHSIIF